MAASNFTQLSEDQRSTNAARTAAEKPVTRSTVTRSNHQPNTNVQRFSAASGAGVANVKTCNREGETGRSVDGIGV